MSSFECFVVAGTNAIEPSISVDALEKFDMLMLFVCWVLWNIGCAIVQQLGHKPEFDETALCIFEAVYLASICFRFLDFRVTIGASLWFCANNKHGLLNVQAGCREHVGCVLHGQMDPVCQSCGQTFLICLFMILLKIDALSSFVDLIMYLSGFQMCFTRPHCKIVYGVSRLSWIRSVAALVAAWHISPKPTLWGLCTGYDYHIASSLLKCIRYVLSIVIYVAQMYINKYLKPSGTAGA